MRTAMGRRPRRRRSPRPHRKRKTRVVSAAEIHDAAAGLRGIATRTSLRYVEALAARKRGVITYSSGNHGQAVAYAAKQFGVRAVIVMPETAPAVKVEGVKHWGGEVVMAGRTSEDRRQKAEELAAREGLAVVPPFDHPDIVAGQATVALEIVEQLPEVETVVV